MTQNATRETCEMQAIRGIDRTLVEHETKITRETDPAAETADTDLLR